MQFSSSSRTALYTLISLGLFPECPEHWDNSRACSVCHLYGYICACCAPHSCVVRQDLSSAPSIILGGMLLQCFYNNQPPITHSPTASHFPHRGVRSFFWQTKIYPNKSQSHKNPPHVSVHPSENCRPVLTKVTGVFSGLKQSSKQCVRRRRFFCGK